MWIAIIFTYIFAIFPLAFSDQLTLSHLIGNWGEIENMFWYVFGTFTNSLTFTGEFSWSNTKKTSTRILIGQLVTFIINFMVIFIDFSNFRLLLGIQYYNNSMLYWIDYCFRHFTRFSRFYRYNGTID